MFTGVLALVSALPIFFLIRADRRSANASDEASRQFAILVQQADTMEKQKEVWRAQYFADHRPKLIVRDVYFSEPFGEVTFEMSNSGGSAAKITGGFIGLDFIAKRNEFKSPGTRSLEVLKDCGFRAGQFRPFALRTSEILQQTIEHRQKAAAGQMVPARLDVPGDLYFFGMIYYADARGEELGATYLTVFRRKWIPRNASFERTPDPDAEYAD